MSTAQDPQYLLIGEILRPHGVIGEVRMKVITHYPERLPQLKTVYLAPAPTASNVAPYVLERMRMHQGYALMKFKGIDDRNQADLLRQLVVMVAIDDAVPLDEGEVYLYQLLGLTVDTEEGETLGKLTDVLETGANDVYIVDSPKYGEVLIPATNETIRSIDIVSGKMIVCLPNGLLPAV